jgi:O-antigen/teichoic acid export membrane protein
MISTIVLARLLSPADFGLVAMVTTFSLLLMNFGLNGFTEAVIQKEDIDHRLASNLFWISVGAGLVLTIGFAGGGSVLAWFYHDPLVARIAADVSLTILLTSAQVLHLALLKRAMCFSQVSANDFISRALSIAVSIILAWRGFGYRSLVYGIVAQPFISTIGAWWLCRWVPGPPSRAQGTRTMLRFAMHVYARFSFNYSTRNTDNVLVGWRFDAQSLGFYKKAYDLFALSAGLFVTSLTAVAISALSRLRRDPVEYRLFFVRALTVVALIAMGLSGDLTLIGRELIRVLLGPGWQSAGRIFTFFGPGIGAMLVYATTDWLHLSLGRPDRWFRWSIFEYAVTALLFVVGLHWGPAGVALAWTVSFWILAIPAFWYAGRPIQFAIGNVISVVWKFTLASMLAGGASALILERMRSVVVVRSSFGAFVEILLASVVFGGLYLSGVILLHRGCAPIRQLAALMREMLPGGVFRAPRVPREHPESIVVLTATVLKSSEQPSADVLVGK